MAFHRIGIDGYNLAMPHGTGVATYGAALATTLRGMGHPVTGVFGLDVGRDPATREVLFYDAVARTPPKLTRWDIRKQFIGDTLRPFRGTRALDVPITDLVEKDAFANRLPTFDRLVSSPRLFETAFHHFGLFGRFLTLRMADPPPIMHWTYPVPVRLAGARNIYTFHDLIPLRLPYTTLDIKVSYHALVAACAAEADQICTVSEASRADIAARFPIPADRLTNTYQASPPPPETLAADAVEDARLIEGVFGLRPQGYFLFFGAIEPKKNLGRLIEAYLSVQSEAPLVVVGARAWQSEDELRLLPKGDSAASIYGQRVAHRIIRLEYLPRPLLMRLVRGARAVVFPSLYEGFGLPALEAMQLGTPVLASTAGSLPEVTGDAALGVDPYSIDAISAALRRLDGDDALRADLAARGLAQAERFSVAAYRDRLAEMYARVIAAPRRA